MGITKEQIEQVFEWVEHSFWDLADLEDQAMELKNQLADYKEGSKGASEIQNKLKEMQPEFNKLQREFTLAKWNIEKIKMLIEIEKSHQ
jgi:predicted RNase H-like nuclease (RuvC/YqgF family)